MNNRKKENKVFLGGTCTDLEWRNEFIEKLQIPYFNPKSDDWTEEDRIEEERQKGSICGILLYVINHEMHGVYSIAEAVQSSNDKNVATILHILPDGFDEHQINSFKAVCDLVKKNGGVAIIDDKLQITLDLINNEYGHKKVRSDQAIKIAQMAKTMNNHV